MLDTKKMKIYVNIILVLIIACFSTYAEDLASQNLHIDEFGESNGPPIKTGFVFYEGEYLDIPYIVSRKGVAIFINEKMIEAPMQWPVEPHPSGDINPDIPCEITKETSLYDEIFKRYIRDKVAYIQKHHTPEEERKIMERVYRNMPFIKEAKLDPKYPDILMVTTYKGEVDPLGLCQPRRKGPDFSKKENILKHLEAQRSYYVKNLSRGDVLFLSSKGGRMVIGQNKKEYLLPLVRILRSRMSNEDKFKAIKKTKWHSHISMENFGEVVTNFQASEQLEKRLKRLPGTVEE